MNTVFLVATAGALLQAGGPEGFGIPQLDTDDVKTDEVQGTLEYHCPPTCATDMAIRIAAATYGVPYTRLNCLARLESTFNPNAQNGRFYGLYQFDEPTFALTPFAQYGRSNAYASAMGAAYLIARGEGSRWPPLARC